MSPRGIPYNHGMSETPQRPWWKLHGLTWASLLSVSVSVFGLNVLSRDLFDTGEAWAASGKSVPWEKFGWPFAWLSYDIMGEMPGELDLFRPFNLGFLVAPKNFKAFQPNAFAANGLIWITLVSGAAFSVERWRRKHPGVLVVSLRAMLAILGLCASVFGLHIVYIREIDEQYGPSIDWLVRSLTQDAVSIFWCITYANVFLAWLAFFDVFGLVWNRLSRRKA
jgi:hypothetical protein